MGSLLNALKLFANGVFHLHVPASTVSYLDASFLRNIFWVAPFEGLKIYWLNSNVQLHYHHWADTDMGLKEFFTSLELHPALLHLEIFNHLALNLLNAGYMYEAKVTTIVAESDS